MEPRTRKRWYVRWALFIGLLAAGGMLWQYTPLHDYLTPETLRRFSAWISSTPAPVLTVAGAYIVASLLLFPVTAMIVITALALPPGQAVVAGALGVAASSCSGYLIGRALGPERVSKLLGPLFDNVRQRIQKNVLVSVFAVRHLPLGPFTLVNIVLGGMHVNFARFVIANSVSLLPGIIAASFFGGQLQKMLASL